MHLNDILVNPNEFVVLKWKTMQQKLELKEMLYIRKLKPPLNKQQNLEILASNFALKKHTRIFSTLKFNHILSCVVFC